MSLGVSGGGGVLDLLEEEEDMLGDAAMAIKFTLGEGMVLVTQLLFLTVFELEGGGGDSKIGGVRFVLKF